MARLTKEEVLNLKVGDHVMANFSEKGIVATTTMEVVVEEGDDGKPYDKYWMLLREPTDVWDGAQCWDMETLDDEGYFECWTTGDVCWLSKLAKSEWTKVLPMLD